MKIIVLIPCLDDADTASELVKEVSRSCEQHGHDCSFLIVDDGSFPSIAQCFVNILPNPPVEVRVLRLARNLGHQRAIACGLCYISTVFENVEAVVTMDSDGEDRPNDVPRLIDELQRSVESVQAVFAERQRRSEGLLFRAGYLCYLSLHRIMIGQAARVGNFSIIRMTLAKALNTDPDLWSHFAATVWKSRIKRRMIPVARGIRRRGRSRLNLKSLVLHGLSAISCYREILVLRALIGSVTLSMLTLVSLLFSFAFFWIGKIQISSAFFVVEGLLFWLLFQSTGLALWQCFNVLQNRHQATFIPLRDFEYFVPDKPVIFSPKHPMCEPTLHE